MAKQKMSAQVLLGKPLKLSNTCLIYPPTLNQVMDTPNYPVYLKLLTESQEDIWDELAENEGDIPKSAPTPLQKLIALANSSPKVAQAIESAIKFFTREEVIIRAEGSIILFTESIKEAEESSQIRYLDAENYFDFQNTIREVVGREKVEAPIIDEHPKIAIIKAKGRRRERIIAEGKAKGGIELSTMLVALSCMNVGFKLLPQYGEISYPAIFELFGMAQDKSRYEADMQLIAGGYDAKKVKPKDWIRSE